MDQLELNYFKQQVIDNLQKANTGRMKRFDHAVYEDAISFVEEMSLADIKAIFSVKTNPNDYNPDLTDVIHEICLGRRKWLYRRAMPTEETAIAKRYSSPSEFKKSRNGWHRPARNTTWSDLRADAAYKATGRIYAAVMTVKETEKLA